MRSTPNPGRSPKCSPGYFISSIASGNKIIFAGGDEGGNATVDPVNIYDASTNTWTVAHLAHLVRIWRPLPSVIKCFLQGALEEITSGIVKRKWIFYDL